MTIKTKTVTKEVEVTESLSCDNCGANIPLVFANDRDELTTQGRNALRIVLDGGYGMYVDRIVDGNLEFVWCGECANGLLKQYPSLATKIRR